MKRDRRLFSVFGRRVFVERTARGWMASYPGSDGKRRPAEDILIPPDVEDDGLERYLTDLCHEWGTPEHDKVIRVSR